MNVSAIVVTRGDVDLTPIRDSLPKDWRMLVWDNGAGECREWTQDHAMWVPSFRWDASDLAVYGRYAAIEHASGDLIYVQDDDCVLPPESIATLVQTWHATKRARDLASGEETTPGWLVTNMPAAFREQHFYADHCLVGFGAVFHRDLPAKAFERFAGTVPALGLSNYGWWLPGFKGNDHFLRTCDVVFTALTPRVLVDVPYENLSWASDENRMWKQPEHIEERQRMLDLVRKVRDV